MVIEPFLGSTIFAPRKHFLHLLCRNCHLRGIAGPGAPHQFGFDRRSALVDEGCQSSFAICSDETGLF